MILWWPKRRMDLSFEVNEGPVTLLNNLTIDGLAPEVDAEYIETTKAELIGAPQSLQTLDLLARSLVLQHQNAGYLDADARLTRQRIDESREDVTINISKGPRIYARSFSTQGHSRVNGGYLRGLIKKEMERTQNDKVQQSLTEDSMYAC